MTDVSEQVRETFRGVSQDVEVPAFDEVAFRAGVRRARRRRTTAVTGWAAAAAGIAAIAVVVMPGLVSSGGSDVAGAPESGPTGRPAVHPEALPAPLFYVVGNRLLAATPDGSVHDLKMDVDGIIGATGEGALVADDTSRLVWVTATRSGEDDGAFTFRRDSGPVSLPDTGPVQSVALSADGRWLAWLDLGGTVREYDLEAAVPVQSVEVRRNGYVTSVSERGVLVSEGGRLMLYGSPDVEVPTAPGGYGWLSDTAGDLVTVADLDDVTRVYDVTDPRQWPGDDHGAARLVDSVPGIGRLAPSADGVVSVDGDAVRLWAGGTSTVLSGVEGRPQSAGWLDEENAVVTSADGVGTTVYLCPIAEGSCTAVVSSEGDVRLAE